MKIGKLRIRRKALSPVIATLLMVAIAVAAAIITYVWSMGLLGGLMGTGGSQTKEQIILEAYDWKTTANKLVVTIRNVGSSEVVLAASYIEGLAAPGGPTGDTVNDKLAIGSTLTYTLDKPTPLTLTTGAAYTVKFATATGGTFTFSVVYGRAS